MYNYIIYYVSNHTYDQILLTTERVILKNNVFFEILLINDLHRSNFIYMNTPIWEPDDNGHYTTIEESLLKKFIEISRNGNLMDISSQLSESEKNKSSILNFDENVWYKSLLKFSNSELLELLKFFVAIEEQIANWQSYENSPAIKINKILKKRGINLDHETLLWIKENSSNRYIPNGRIL